MMQMENVKVLTEQRGVQITQKFSAMFGAEPLLVRSPGRINIIGEHTDYNGGLVMPAAIDKAVYVAVARRTDKQIHLYSENYGAHFLADITSIRPSEMAWANYILGVANEFVQLGHQIDGFNLYIVGDVPLGAGLSSSAAVECATAFALQTLHGISLSKMDLALISQRAEHNFAGVNCGIMDQFASVFGRSGHAMLLDCRSMEYVYVPLSLEGYKLVLLNTNVKHSLSDSAYNRRREECELGLSWVREFHSEVEYLCNVDQEMLLAYVKPKDEAVYRRCRYVVAEIGRVKAAALALSKGELSMLGQLMFDTHRGLSEDYEVSCRELDFLVDQVKGLDAVLGARMMGGGFGGCTLNIVRNGEVEALVERLSDTYLKEFGLELDAYVVETSDGSHVVA